MKKLAVLVAAIMLLSVACDLDTGGPGRESAHRPFRAGKRVNARQHRLEARRTRQRLQRRLAIEQRRKARLAEQRRERRERLRREEEAVAVAAPEPAPQPESCTDGYDPCLPPAADYDCEGGSGDGPAYTGYVTVTGYDTYGLDADGDGVGCES